MDVPTHVWRIRPGIEHMHESGNRFPVLAAAKNDPELLRGHFDIRESPFGGFKAVIRQGKSIQADRIVPRIK